ncbi:carbohydrate-binding module family 20 protein [Atractiella rhizophila]|nr:carbohydrate-binding module family 20 protein [Atractiella rhizophila]
MLAHRILPLFSLSGALVTGTGHFRRQADGLDAFVTAQTEVAYQGVLNNIGPNGSKAPGAHAGIVVASPSSVNPPYFYTWTRDSALVMKQLVQGWTISDYTNDTLKTILEDYISAQAVIQHIDNPSGGYTTGGLGEPKFEVNETAFTGDWGRPQRDGPALRAITMINFANELRIAAPGAATQAYIMQNIWPLVEADLNYVSTYWNRTGFDLWEEVNGSSFFTIGNQFRALSQGHQFSQTMSHHNATYAPTANKLWCFFQSFYNEDQAYAVSNINTRLARTGKDVNSILTSIHLFDAAVGCESSTWQPCSDKALANHKAVVDSFRAEYNLNAGIPSSNAVAIGRYNEDVYYNGNPWYLATLAAAEQLYDAIYTWKKISSIPVTSISLPFFTQIYPSAMVGDYPSSSSDFDAIISAVQTYADGFIAIVRQYLPADGSMTEQFDRNTGVPLSAADLTWSYSSFLTLSQARKGLAPPSWNALATDPDITTCDFGNTGPTVSTTFNAQAQTVDGEYVFVVGSIGELGSWAPDNAIPLNADNYPIWSVANVTLHSFAEFEYKYIKKNAAGTVTWQVDPNNKAQLPEDGEFVINDTVTWQ